MSRPKPEGGFEIDMRNVSGRSRDGELALTRTTAGTGIGFGLGLVRQLVAAMGGSVDEDNRSPGAEFRIVLRRA